MYCSFKHIKKQRADRVQGSRAKYARAGMDLTAWCKIWWVFYLIVCVEVFFHLLPRSAFAGEDSNNDYL